MVYCSKLEKSYQERNVSIKSEGRGCSAYQISIREHLTWGSDIIGHTLPPPQEYLRLNLSKKIHEIFTYTDCRCHSNPLSREPPNTLQTI